MRYHLAMRVIPVTHDDVARLVPSRTRSTGRVEYMANGVWLPFERLHASQLLVAATRPEPRADSTVASLLPSCARQLLSRPGTLRPLVRAPQCAGCTNLSSVAHAYLLHYKRNVERYAFQRMQLRRLGLNVSVVAGYDAEDVDEAVRACVLRPGSRMAAPYVSQTLKLYAALADMVANTFDPVKLPLYASKRSPPAPIHSQHRRLARVRCSSSRTTSRSTSSSCRRCNPH